MFVSVFGHFRSTDPKTLFQQYLSQLSQGNTENYYAWRELAMEKASDREKLVSAALPALQALVDDFEESEQKEIPIKTESEQQAQVIRRQQYQAALIVLGLCHTHGLGKTKMNSVKGLKFFNKASRHSPIAMMEASLRLKVLHKHREATTLVLQAAQRGLAQAMKALGDHYFNSDENERNWELAIYWWERCARDEPEIAEVALTRIFKPEFKTALSVTRLTQIIWNDLKENLPLTTATKAFLYEHRAKVLEFIMSEQNADRDDVDLLSKFITPEHVISKILGRSRGHDYFGGSDTEYDVLSKNVQKMLETATATQQSLTR